MTEETLRLPPFPDELLAAEKKEQVITWLRGWELPPHIASGHFGRWAAYLGVTLTRADYVAVRRDFPYRPPET